MFDIGIENTVIDKLIEAYGASKVRDNGEYIYSKIELDELSFQIIYPGREVLVSDYFNHLASLVISDIHRLNQLAKENTPDEDDYSLHYINLFESEVELHYVYNLANASNGVFFKIEKDGSLSFDDWG